MTKPKILYRYSSLVSGNKKVEKHKVTKDCAPQIEMFVQSIGNLWRCKCASGDHYGYASLDEAKKEEIDNTRIRIYEENKWLQKLIKQ